MKYLGSKNRIAKQLLEIMLPYAKNRTWVEPFVGGANMIDKIKGLERIGADNNEYVIALLNKMSKPNFKAPYITKEKYLDIKNNIDKYEKWIVGFAGTQLSFGATWFGSFRRDNTGLRDYSKEAINNVEKQSKNIQGVSFIHSSYENLKIPKKSIIYCDIPYNTKATKGKYKENFNHEKFWQWCRTKSLEGHYVFVSEYEAPTDFKCMWKKEMQQRMNNNVNTKKGIEKLFLCII